MCPMDRIVTPPIFRTRSAISSVMARSDPRAHREADGSRENGPTHVPVEVLRLQVKREYVARRALSAPEMSLTDWRSMSVGVANGAFAWQQVHCGLALVSPSFVQLAVWVCTRPPT